MSERGVTCNVVTYNTLVGGLCKKMMLLEAEKLIDQMKNAGLCPSVITYNTLISPALCSLEKKNNNVKDC